MEVFFLYLFSVKRRLIHGAVFLSTQIAWVMSQNGAEEIRGSKLHIPYCGFQVINAGFLKKILWIFFCYFLGIFRMQLQFKISCHRRTRRCGVCLVSHVLKAQFGPKFQWQLNYMNGDHIIIRKNSLGANDVSSLW